MILTAAEREAILAGAASILAEDVFFDLDYFESCNGFRPETEEFAAWVLRTQDLPGWHWTALDSLPDEALIAWYADRFEDYLVEAMELCQEPPLPLLVGEYYYEPIASLPESDQLFGQAIFRAAFAPFVEGAKDETKPQFKLVA